MSFRIIKRNRMEDLSEVLRESLSGDLRGRDIFSSSEIIVPNKGMARYLTWFLTEREGITANLEFPFLMAFLQRRVFRMEGSFPPPGISETPDPAAFLVSIRPETIVWRLERILPEFASDEDFHELRSYLENSDPLRLHQLCGRLADLYDRYLSRHPQWILAWEANTEPADFLNRKESLRAIARRQGKLWRAIATGDWTGRHFPEKYRALMTGGNVPVLDRTVRLFGFSSIPGPHLEILERLGEKNDIELYAFTPCLEYFGEARSRKQELVELKKRWFSSSSTGEAAVLPEDLADLYFQDNLLLGSFGKAGLEFMLQTLSADETDDVPSPDPEGGGILSEVQKLILHNSPAGNDGHPVPGFAGRRDGGIQIHSCYSPLREVEALREFLLNCFEESGGELTQNDVLVMSPDCDVYAPLLDAVFHSSGNNVSGRSLPEISRTDRTLSSAGSPLRAFLKILNIGKTDFEFSEVMDILEEPEIAKKFLLTDEDLAFCRARLAEAGIRWGYDASDREKSAGTAFPETSWRAGLDRILAGIIMKEDGPFAGVHSLAGTIYPLNPGGGTSAVVWGALCSFVDGLHRVRRTLSRFQRDGAEFSVWRDFLSEEVSFFFGEGSEPALVLDFFMRNLRMDLADADVSPRIVPDVMLSILKDRLEQTPVYGGYPTGKITFCAMRPMRNIPAKIICLLGMNHDAFPPSRPHFGFDLESLTGAVSPRDEDRQMFFEQLLSARKCFYISYMGRGIRDNKSRPPSPCVDELQSWMTDVFGKESFLFEEHPLHPFSELCFRKDSGFHSHSEINYRAALYLSSKGNDETALPLLGLARPLSGDLPAELREIVLKDLLAFYRNPAQTFTRKRMKSAVFLPKDFARMDSEPFSTDKDETFDVYAFQDKVYSWISEAPESADLSDAVDYFRACGLLTPGGYAKQDLEAFAQPLIQLRTDFKRILQTGEKTVLPALEFSGPIRLTVPSLDVFKTSDSDFFQIFCGPGKDNEYKILDSIIFHYAANLSNPVETRILSVGPKETAERVMPPLTHDDAVHGMETLLLLYGEGMRRPLPFFPRSSYAVWNAKSEEDAAAKLAGTWEGSPNSRGDREKFGLYFGENPPPLEEVAPPARMIFDLLGNPVNKGRRKK